MENFETFAEPVNWKSMYMTLLDGITCAIDLCEDKTVSGILVKAMLDAEEQYINSAPECQDSSPST